MTVGNCMARELTVGADLLIPAGLDPLDPAV
jgi:hypothetical protein